MGGRYQKKPAAIDVSDGFGSNFSYVAFCFAPADWWASCSENPLLAGKSTLVRAAGGGGGEYKLWIAINRLLC